jgi:hypothetical protein
MKLLKQAEYMTASRLLPSTQAIAFRSGLGPYKASQACERFARCFA